MTNELKEMIKNNKFPRECFSKAQCSNMRSIDIPDFMEWYDDSMLIKLRGNVRLKNNNSVVLNGKWAIDFGGDNQYYTGIDFCVKYLGLSTYGAMFIINEYLKGEHKPSMAIHTLTPIAEIETAIANGKYLPAQKIKSVYAYLNKTRGIPTDTIHRFIEDNSLYAEELDRGYNLLFPMYKDDKIIGFERTGILSNSEKRFKGCIISEEHIGFTYCYQHKPSTEKIFYIFESSIDLMSFVALADEGLVKLPSDNSIMLLSVRGLQGSVLEKYTNTDTEITLCVDNDEAGEGFYKGVKSKYRYLSYAGSVLNKYGVKDWNDLLRKADSIATPIDLR